MTGDTHVGATLLIVDDEAPVRHMFRRTFESLGYRVALADSASAALEAVVREPIDLVITDLKMPDQDGLYLAQRLIEQDRHRPVVLVTGYADLGSAQRAVSLGIYAYFTKPIDVHQVLNAVQKGLEHRRLSLENLSYQRDLERKVELRTQDLERAYRELIQAEKLSEVGRLAAGVVHEVLNPLSVVMGRIEMALMEVDGDAARRSLKIARQQLRRAVKIMDNLRDFSRQRPPQRTSVDLNALLAHAIELLSHDIKRYGISVETAFDGVPDVEADADQLGQVFLNVIKNAIEAMPDGGRLSIRTRSAENGARVEVAVADTGVGIALENEGRIFDLFFTTKKNGTGLGLGICRGIVEAHGGAISVDSRVGEGATFVILLPIDGTLINRTTKGD